MSSLNIIEKRTLEKFLQMGSGYVLDFSNKTFQEFVVESTGLDIAKEDVGGLGSKANRLRHFWSNEPDHVVGKLLKDLVEYAETDSPSKEQCRAIAGRLLSGPRVTTITDQERIWGETGYRVFLSHKAEVKAESGALKEGLSVFGISAFVAHADVKPTTEWQTEIENALASMHAFVALLTKGFHASDWTDQEVGYALARGVPMVALKLERDPYGFIGKFQALSCDWTDAAVKIARLLIVRPQMLEAFIETVCHCTSYDQGNALSRLFPQIKSLTGSQAHRLVSAFNVNPQLQGSFGFTGSWPSKFGPGFASFLTQATGKSYEFRSEAGHGMRVVRLD
jgi:hypothetical protein